MDISHNLRICNHQDVDLRLWVGVEDGEAGPGHGGHPVAEVLVVGEGGHQDQETQFTVVDVHPPAHLCCCCSLEVSSSCCHESSIAMSKIDIISWHILSSFLNILHFDCLF